MSSVSVQGTGVTTARWPRWILLAAVFTSGGTSLVDEVFWRRLLVLLTGVDAGSLAVITAAFMAGLGLGGLAGGYVADRVSPDRRIPLFAVSESIVAALVWLSPNLLHGAPYEPWLQTQAQPLVWTIAFVALLFPTLLMGFSLPLLAKTLADDAADPGREATLPFGCNAFGGALGALLAVAVVARAVDIATALRLSALVTAACAGTAWLLRRRFSYHAPGRLSLDLRADTPANTTFTLRTWLLLYAASGFIALSLEILWLRLLGVMIHSTAFTFGVVLAVYIGFLALGAMWSVSARFERRNPTQLFLLAQAVVALYAVTAVTLLVSTAGTSGLGEPLWAYWAGAPAPDFSAALSRLPQAIAGTPVGEIWGPLGLLLTLYGVLPAVLIAPPAFLMGMSFGFAQRAVQTDRATLGRRFGFLYAANIAGSVLGTLVTGFVLLDSIGTAATLRLVAIMGGAFLLPLAWRRAPRMRAVGVGMAAWLLIAVLSPSRDQLWNALHSAQPGTIVVRSDSSGVFAVRDLGHGDALVAINGVSQSRLPFGGTHTALGSLPVLLHDDPARVLIIGLGSGDTVFASGARKETNAIDCVETMAGALPALDEWRRQSGYDGLTALFADPRVHHTVGGGRRFLRTHDTKYDVIEADALMPTAPFSGHLYSVEFFTLVRSRLNPRGLAVSWMPTDRTRDSFVAAFPYAVELENVLIGSADAISFDPARIRARLEDPFTQARFEEAGVQIAEELAPYLAGTPIEYGPSFDRSTFADLNSDLFPRDEFMVPRRIVPSED